MSPNVIIHPDNSVVRISGPGVSIGEAEVAAEAATRAAADTAITTKIGSGVYQVFNVKDYGALGDDATDDTAAIQAAIDAVPQTGNSYTSGGIVFFPRSRYLVTELDVEEKTNLHLVGVGSQQGGSTLRSSIASGSVVSMSSCNGCRVENLTIQSDNASFIGTVLDLTKTTSDTTLITVRNSHLRAELVSSGTVKLAELTGCTLTKFDSCHFYGGATGAYGIGDPATQFSNGISFDDCMFQGQDSYPIRNPHQSWRITNCCAEPRRDGSAGFILSDVAVPTYGLVVEGCMPQDADATGTWITTNGGGITIIGNYFCVGATAVKLNAATTGLSIIGNRYWHVPTGLDINGQTLSRFTHLSNTFDTVTNEIVGTVPQGSVIDTTAGVPWVEVSGGVGFSNSWVNLGGGTNTAAYRKLTPNLIQLKGTVQSGTIGSSIFTLPSGMRPPAKVIRPTVSNDAFARLDIESSGNVVPFSGNNVYVSIDCTFGV